MIKTNNWNDFVKYNYTDVIKLTAKITKLYDTYLEDIVHDILIIFKEKQYIEKYNDKYSFDVYIYYMIKYIFISILRKKHDITSSVDNIDIYGKEDIIVDVLLLKFMKNILTSREYDVIINYYINNLDTYSIASLDNISHQAVTDKLNKAINKIKDVKHLL
jgi:RNA polymerase sigma factor (sigma-70 family)